MAYFDLSKNVGVYHHDRISQTERNGRGTIGGLNGLGGSKSRGMLAGLLQALNNLRTSLVPKINAQISSAYSALQSAQYEIDAARSRVENSSDPSALQLASRLDPLAEALATAEGQITDAQAKMGEIDAVLALPDGDPGQAGATAAEATANAILTSLKGISATATKAVQTARQLTNQIAQAEQRAAAAEAQRVNRENALAAAEQRKIDQQFAIEQARAQSQLQMEQQRQASELAFAQQQQQMAAQLQAQQQAALLAASTPTPLPAPAYSGSSTLPPPPAGYMYQTVDTTYQQPYNATYTGLPAGYTPQAAPSYFQAPSQPQSLPGGWTGTEAAAQSAYRSGAPIDQPGFTTDSNFMPGFELFGLGGASRRGMRGRRGLLGLGAEAEASSPVSTAAGRLAQSLVAAANPWIGGSAPPPPPPPPEPAISPGTLIAAGLAAWIGVPKILALLNGKKR